MFCCFSCPQLPATNCTCYAFSTPLGLLLQQQQQPLGRGPGARRGLLLSAFQDLKTSDSAQQGGLSFAFSSRFTLLLKGERETAAPHRTNESFAEVFNAPCLCAAPMEMVHLRLCVSHNARLSRLTVPAKLFFQVPPGPLQPPSRSVQASEMGQKEPRNL